MLIKRKLGVVGAWFGFQVGKLTQCMLFVTHSAEQYIEIALEWAQSLAESLVADLTTPAIMQGSQMLATIIELTLIRTTDCQISYAILITTDRDSRILLVVAVIRAQMLEVNVPLDMNRQMRHIPDRRDCDEAIRRGRILPEELPGRHRC